MILFSPRVGMAVLVLCMVAAAAAQPTFQDRVAYDRPKSPAVPPTDRVAQLIARLADDALETRRAARRSLQAMGPSIRSQLQGALERTRLALPPADVRRDGTILGRHFTIAELTLLIDYCDDMRRSAASIVTLHYKNAPLLEVLHDLGSQADAPVRVSTWPRSSFGGWLDNRVSIDLERTSYWGALRAIRRDLGLNSTFGGDAVTFYRPTQLSEDLLLDAANAVVAGPIWMVPASVTRETPGSITVTMQVAAEPRVGAGAYVIIKVDEYTDDQGRSLLSRDQQPSIGFTYTPGRRLPSTISLQLGSPAPGRQVGTLKGRVGVSVGPPGLDIEIADLTRADPQAFEWDATILTVKSSARVGSQYVVTGELSTPVDSPLSKAMADAGATGLSGENARLLLDRLGLLDASRRVIRRRVDLRPARREADRDVMGWALTTMDYVEPPRLRPPPSTDVCVAQCVPTALTWSTPSETRWLMVPFEMHDIGVPAVR